MRRNLWIMCALLVLTLSACGSRAAPASTDAAAPAASDQTNSVGTEETYAAADTAAVPTETGEPEPAAEEPVEETAAYDAMWAPVAELDREEKPWVPVFLTFVTQHGLDPSQFDPSRYTGQWTLITSYIPGESVETKPADLSAPAEYETFITDQRQLIYAPLPDRIEDQFEAVKNDFNSKTSDKLFIDYVMEAFGQPATILVYDNAWNSGDADLIWDFGTVSYIMDLQYHEDTGNYYMSASRLYNNHRRIEELLESAAYVFGRQE